MLLTTWTLCSFSLVWEFPGEWESEFIWSSFARARANMNPLENHGLLDLAPIAAQLRWVGPASATFIVLNAASFCVLSEPVPTNY